MKAKEIRKLSEEELTIEVKRLRRKMFDLRTQSVTEKIQDVSQFGKLRRDIAQLLTEQSRRSLVAAGGDG
jgi:large subunit ribosomal protein L29